MIEEGSIRAGDGIALVDRPNPDFGFDRLVEIVNFGDASLVELEAMAEMTGLASRLQARAQAALAQY